MKFVISLKNFKPNLNKKKKFFRYHWFIEAFKVNYKEKSIDWNS